MNTSATILNLQGQFQLLIKKRARAYSLDLEDAQQEAACAICEAVLSFNPSRGTRAAWVATQIDTKLKRLAYGRGVDKKIKEKGLAISANPLAGAVELTEDLGLVVNDQEQEEQDTSSIPPLPPLAGIYGRIRALALRGMNTKEIAKYLRLSRRRLEQLLADKAAILDARRLADAQGDLFGEVTA